MARLSTHVLDISRGSPAAGVVVELHFVAGADRRQVATAVTNTDGRTDNPLVAADRLDVGIYELTFHAADYFRRAGAALSDPPFLGDIVIRIGISDPRGHYHVPLLLTPFGYSTYRGS
jgi:5-hydroxyisourate hydrolase